MQPLKITITGDFWDCQIYRGRLYLWDFNGELRVYHWDQLVNSLIDNEKNWLATSWAFLNGNHLYRYHDIFEDRDFYELLSKKFEKIEGLKREITLDDAYGFLIGQQDNPFKDLPSDTEISSNKLYAITDQGLWSTTAHRGVSARYPVSSRPKKLWDNKLLSLTANNYAAIALSGGDEGLFQYKKESEGFFNWYNLGKDSEVEKGIIQISDKHSLFNDWNNLSIYSSSDVSESYLSLFEWKKIDTVTKVQRQFSEVISEKQIFKDLNLNGSLSWGAGDKIYKSTQNGLVVTRFNNYAKGHQNGHFFSEPEFIQFNEFEGSILEGKVCLFGTIVENENSLTVIQSNGEIFKINEPITRWRIYPRSKNYENHLHVITEDRLDIYSFNHDYFIDQDEKNFGIMYKG